MKSDKIKILYFNLFTWLGGGEYSVYYLAKNLNRVRFEPILLFNKRGPFTEKAEVEGIETIFVPFVVAKPLTLLNPKNIFINILTSFRIMKLIRDRKLDVIHCSDVFSLILLLPSLVLLRIPVVYNVIVFYSKLRCWLFNLLSLLFVNRIVANSEKVRIDLLSKTSKLGKITTVAYNGIDKTLFFQRNAEVRSNLISKLGLPNNKKVIGLIGRYEVWKGHQIFIYAAKRLLQFRNDLCFLIVGGAITQEVAPQVTEYKEEVIKQINEQHLQESIILWDHRDDIPDIMASLDVCVCPSEYEPYGLVLLEAYACNVPVVASRTVGALEVLQGNPGIFVAEPMDVDSFVREITNALNYDRSLLESQATKLTERANWKSYAKSFEGLYEKVIGK